MPPEYPGVHRQGTSARQRKRSQIENLQKRLRDQNALQDTNDTNNGKQDRARPREKPQKYASAQNACRNTKPCMSGATPRSPRAGVRRHV